MKKQLAMLGLTALMSSSMAAIAATITYNFVNADNGAGYTSGAITITGSDGSTVDASATNEAYPDLVSYIDSSGRGLYVCTGSSAPSGHCGSGYGDQPHVDGVGVNESVILDFGGRTVRLIEATFHESLSGNFDLDADGNVIGDEIPLSTLVSFLGMENAVGHVFSFSADGENDWFKLSSITVQEVPLPGTLGLLGLGLAALGTVRRRKPA